MPVNMLRNFFRMEAAGGIVLVLAAALALIVANSPLAPLYDRVFDIRLWIGAADLEIDKPLRLWVNDGLMAVFFFLVGLEIKREFLQGELATREQAMLPAFGAVGGMAIPALIYVAVNAGHPENLNGWAIPAATDIAFALGVLTLLGPRVPLSLKVLLTAIAILDDLGAIIIIAIFYTYELSTLSLVLASSALVVLIAFNLFGVRKLAPYILVGLVMWACVLKSGVHATLAGVALAMTIPLRPDADAHSPLISLEHGLHKWVAFGVLPMFGFANAGVSFAGMGWNSFLQPVTLGIALGLFFGKQIGVFIAIWLAVRLRLARLPEGAGWRHVYGVAALCGIGFTMSLFIGSLAWPHEDNDAAVRLGVLCGSIASALLGAAMLMLAPNRAAATTPAPAPRGVEREPA